ncbi:cell division protein FtsZ [Vibrio alginolyticus]|uniref:cell division protein FtsZ n=1 Tax=Vibrio alginolyticus TaxID=663 RepID=UPI0006CAA057|nr:cell division protein FtsZ [Vibrio alginolyticus]CAH7143735.1 cell division protein FtsZ [Vibrio chagasii]CAH7234818.1 cell division protein FtsZ [Vibrio chagasii]
MSDISSPVIKLLGVGGGGVNTINHAIQKNIHGVEKYCLNTDAQSLASVTGLDDANKIVLGHELTRGAGAGADHKVGRDAAIESEQKIREILEGADMVFIASGMGGGTGTGASPEVARIAKELGILTVAVVTKPFPFEGDRRGEVANEGIELMKDYVDSIIIIPNERLLTTFDRSMSLLDAFSQVDSVLSTAVAGITEIILNNGMQNIDFADIKTVMQNRGAAIMGMGRATGEDRALQSIIEATTSPLLSEIKLNEAKGIIVSIAADTEISLSEYEIIGQEVEKYTSADAVSKIGVRIDPDLDGEMIVTVVATGLQDDAMEIINMNIGARGLKTKKNNETSVQKEQTAKPKERPAVAVPSFLQKPSK